MAAPDASGQMSEQCKAHRQHCQQADQHSHITRPQRPAEQVEAPGTDVQQHGLMTAPAQPGQRIEHRAYSSQWQLVVVVARHRPLQVPGNRAGQRRHRPEHEKACGIAQLAADGGSREADGLQAQRIDEREEHHAGHASGDEAGPEDGAPMLDQLLAAAEGGSVHAVPDR
ncbi:hypothetical protein G6F65_018012 [Rhizopus arrhizus]|nr:hypothetical protein G6F65_018012 [Rhizopus arrhizus]